jgi:predicted AAA+ superfamily ATPase
MKPWWQVAIPHKDIREGRIGDFAADLRSILKNEATIEYQDPETFFKRTHLTKGLENIIRDVLLVLSGKEDSKIIQIQTPFGGGKTHALVALYHLIKSGGRTSHIDDVKRILDCAGLSEVPEAKVAVFVGTVPDPLKGKTPWGEIAEQLGVYDEVEEHDARRITPGREILEALLKRSQPVLILVDELTEYIVKAKEFEDQVFAFCQELTEAVKSSKQCVLLCTLPSSAPYGERGERVLNQLQRIFGRMQMIYTPVEGEEVYQILRKRLFEDLGDEKAHEVVAGEYFDFYQRLGEEVPREVREVSYREKMKKAYPFHPELIDALYERWGTIPTFQRTRHVLGLLAEVISDLFMREDQSPLIQPPNINLANPRIRRRFVEHIGEVFESVVRSDIAGEDAKAVKIDRYMGTEYARFKVASGLATCIFFYSFSGGERKGATAQRLRLAFLRPEVPPAIIGDALRRLEDIDGPLYLHLERGLYYFDSKVGLNRLVVEREEAVREDELEAELRREVEKASGRDFEVFVWPRSSADVPDSKKLKMAILPFDFVMQDPRTAELVQEVLTKYSTGFRTYKNTLMLLVADQNEYGALKTEVRRYLAINAIKEDRERMRTLSEEDRERVNQRAKDVESSVRVKAVSVYRYLAKASKEGVATFDMGIATVGERLTLTGRARDFLVGQEILLKKLAPKVVLERAFSKDEDQKSFTEIWEAFLKYPELPVLESESVLKSAIAQGVQNGVFGISIGEKVRYSEPVSVDEITEDAIVLRREVAERLMREKISVAPGVSVTPAAEGAKAAVEVTERKAPQPEVIRKVEIKAQVPWDRLSDLMKGVLAPLRREGAQIAPLEVRIEATSEKGISKDTLDLKVKETLNQIGAKVVEEKAD